MNIEKYLNKVFLKDVLDLLKELPDGSVDMVYGDPDYNVGVKYGDKSYTKTFDEYTEWYTDLARESLNDIFHNKHPFQYLQKNLNFCPRLK